MECDPAHFPLNFVEVVERVAKARLSEHLERRARHPAVDVEYFCSPVAGESLPHRIT